MADTEPANVVHFGRILATVGCDLKIVAHQGHPEGGVVVAKLAGTSQRIGHRLPIGIGRPHR